jgi:hypothetical protein
VSSMNQDVYGKVKEFKRKYPMTISWRLKQHSKIARMHLNPDEEIIYSFAAQKNDNPFDITTTAVVALTNKRIIIAQKRVVFGYFFKSITPDMFNDLTVKMGLIWGKIYIDTIKEFVKFSNIQREALPEIETAITSYMMEAKKDYQKSE